jgi:UDP:flavonoid glycosyltransferase YjiC (YdhE family)
VVAHLGISSLTLSGPEVAFFGSGLPPARTAQQRARNMATTRFMQSQVFPIVQTYINDVLKNCGASKLPSFVTDAVITLPDVYFQLGLPALEYDRALPPAIRFIGALPAAKSNRSLPSWWGDVEAARATGRKIVMVTQGTIANADLGQLVLPSLAALARQDDVLLLATTSGADPASLEVPENARVADFIPYSAAFPYLDLLITNGGFGGVLLALRHGVPLLVAGDSEEKPEIAARIVHAGVGISLGTGNPPAALIEAAARQIIVDPEYRAGAARLASQLETLDALGTIEAVLAEERAKLSAAA